MKLQKILRLGFIGKELEDHAEAAKTAESVGIKTYFYDHTKEDVDALTRFIDGNL